jgi:hypothetical protein
MQFEELKNEIKKVPLDTLRCDADNNFEAVVVKEELKKLKERLEKFFGTPAYPSQHSLSFPMRQTLDGFGGIQPGQTLYFWNKGQETIFAMLWPWKDGKRTTLKIIQK